MPRQTSHVIVPRDTPGPRKTGQAARPRGLRRARCRPQPGRQPQLLPAGEVRGRRGPARNRGQVHPRGQGQPEGLLWPHQGRRGVSAERAYRSLFARQHRQPRRNPHTQTADAPGRGSQATVKDADQGAHAHPHPALLSATGGSSANWPWPRASRTGTSAKPSAAAKPTAKPAPPSTPASTAWDDRRIAREQQRIRKEQRPSGRSHDLDESEAFRPGPLSRTRTMTHDRNPQNKARSVRARLSVVPQSSPT